MLIHATFPRKIHAHYRPDDRAFRLGDDAGHTIKDLRVDDVRICVEQQETLPIATLPGPSKSIRVHPLRGGWEYQRHHWRYAMIVGPDCGYLLDTHERTVVALDTGELFPAEDTVLRQRAAGGAT